MDFQKKEKAGRRSLPTVHSQPTHPAAAPARYPGRRSPRQMPKARYSQPQPQPSKNARSATVVNRGRRGRRNP